MATVLKEVERKEVTVSGGKEIRNMGDIDRVEIANNNNKLISITLAFHRNCDYICESKQKLCPTHYQKETALKIIYN